jgi:hypothetical protein
MFIFVGILGSILGTAAWAGYRQNQKKAADGRAGGMNGGLNAGNPVVLGYGTI